MTDSEQRIEAKRFADTWKGRGYEKGDSQTFWISLLRDVFGVENTSEFIKFEEHVHIDRDSFIDGMIPSTKVMIDYSGPPAHPGRSLAQLDRASAHLIQSAFRHMPIADQPIY